MSRILIVDDDAGIRESAAMTLEKVGHRTFTASDAASAMQLLRHQRIDVVVSDIYMPGDDGLTLLKAIGDRSNPPRVILMTGRGSIETTALAQRSGAFDYLAKPFELSELIATVNRAVTPERNVEAAIEPAADSRIIGSHPAMVEMYKAMSRVAATNLPVLIQGESGSGKELVASAIHDISDRREGPFVAVNCGAIPDTLLENELFGSVRGAYTDARQDRRGALTRADGGTLFLDEIGDTSPAFQVKLLRFLQDGLVTPLGSDKSIRVSVRVIAATHRDVRERVAAGTFREDLYYRLAAYEIRVPPLRERTSDIPLLVQHFKRRAGEEMHRDSIAGPSQAALDALAGYPWPGNVRELEQVVRRTVIDSGSLTDAAAILRAIGGIATAPDSRPAEVSATAEEEELISLDEVERRHIENVLRATNGNQTQAAFILGIERKTLARKIRRYSIALADSDGN